MSIPLKHWPRIAALAVLAWVALIALACAIGVPLALVLRAVAYALEGM